MKQIVQNYKTGILAIEEMPEPVVQAGGVLVQTYHSLISAGTEKTKIDDSKKSILGMAKSRPDKRKQVLQTLAQHGPVATFRKVMNRLDSFTTLGYSLAGKVVEVGEGVSGFNIGDMVACGGEHIATHAELNWVPVNLCCKIPFVSDDVSVPSDSAGYLATEMAAFTTVGAIAMQGVRQADVRVGENVAVIGLGLVGLVTCLILKASGCRVIGIDIDPNKVKLALELGIDSAINISSDDAKQTVSSFSDGYGVDAVLLATATTSNDPIILAADIARDRATIVGVGVSKMDVPRGIYFAKELTLKQSRSYGPGRYDPYYEQDGQDYPIGYVRWTEKRNMQSFLNLMASGKIDIRPLITHRFDFGNSEEAYKLIEGGRKEFYVGIVLKYDVGQNNLALARTSKTNLRSAKTLKKINLGVIGAGNFARTMLLPHLGKGDVNLVGVATSRGISAKDTARKFNFDFCTTDYKEILENESINAILIATRHNLHGKLVLEALKNGKHVYTEKPLCIHKEELEEISALYKDPLFAEKAPMLMLGFNRRHAPFIKKMSQFFQNRTEPMVLTYRVNAGFMEKELWYQQREVGGGRIIGEVCHFVDTFQYLTGALPTSVFAQTIKTNNQETTLEDNVLINIQFSDGSIGSIIYVANGDPKFSKEYVEVFCENSVAVMDNFSTLLTSRKGVKKEHKSLIQDKGHKEEMKLFVDVVKGEQPVPTTFESIRATTITSLNILESIATGKPVKIEGY